MINLHKHTHRAVLRKDNKQVKMKEKNQKTMRCVELQNVFALFEDAV